MGELTALQQKIGEATDTMRKFGEDLKTEAKKFGDATAETKSAYEKSNTRIDELELELKRMSLVSNAPAEGKNKSPEQKAREAAFYKWVRHGRNELEPQERKALVEDATGLILVPEDLEAEIIRALPGLTPLRGMCRTRTTNRDKIRARSLTEVAVGWGALELGVAITEATMTPSEQYIYVEDLYGLTKIGEDELMDTDVNLQALLADSFRVAIATAENTAFVSGTGHAAGKQPLGVAVNTTLLTGLTTGCGANTTSTYGHSWTTDDTLIMGDLLRCEYALPVQYLNGASWLVHRSTELLMRNLVAAVTGTYLWQPSFQIGQPNQFDGKPVVNAASLNIPTDTLWGTNVVFGNFREGYLILDRLGITLQRLDELYAEAGLVGFKVHFRVGGGVIRPDAFRLIVNDV